MLQFTDDLGASGVSLAVSLHAPTQALRATFVPAARAYPLDKLMRAAGMLILVLYLFSSLFFYPPLTFPLTFLTPSTSLSSLHSPPLLLKTST